MKLSIRINIALIVCLHAVLSIAQSADPEPAQAGDAVPQAETAEVVNPPGDGESLLLGELERGRLGADYIRVTGADGGDILARYIRQDQEPGRGAVLVVPGHGRLITNDAALAAIAREFPPNEWTVMAVQMPLLKRGQSLDDYRHSIPRALERITVAMNKLAGDGIERVVIYAADGSAELVTEFLRSAGAAGRVYAFAIGGYWKGDLADITLPVAEFVDAEDKPAIAAAKQRGTAARRNSHSHRTVHLAGLRAGDRHASASLARRLRGWLKVLTDNPGFAARN